MVPPPPSSPSPVNPQMTQQFLSSVLSQRGPSALPYSEDAKWLIRQHLVSLTSNYSSLEPKTATFTHNDGRTVNLLQADGTIPMSFQGVTYNIPVVVWLMESYPRHPPCVFVNPTRDMIIKRPHPHVNPSGLVSTPYLQNWIYPSSNLVDLIRQLSTIFSRDPPLYSQRRPNPNPNPPPGHGYSPVSSNLGSGGGSGGFPRPAIPPRAAYPQSPYGSVGGSGGGGVGGRVQSQTDDPTEVFKRNAISKLVEMVHGDVAGLRKAKEADMEGLFNAQAVLRQREQQLNLGLKEMQEEKEALEQQLQMVLMNSDVLEGWLRENEGKVGNSQNVNVEDAFVCADPLSKQMLDCTSSDLAIEDAIYSLDKGAQEEVVPFDQYLRSVRLLSREQFLQRATAAKVRAAQMQAHVTSMAARVNHYG